MNGLKMKTLMLFALTFSQSVWSQQTADYRVVPLPQRIEFQKDKPFVLTCPLDSLLGTSTVKTSVDAKGLVPDGYRLTISKKGIEIVGGSDAGVFYGLQTLRKSLPNHVNGQETVSVILPAVVINDQPRFGYRGMHLDCARHFFSVSEVKQYLDMMALHNMNRFHWHLTDDQGWRIEIKKYPRLSEFGSIRTGTVIGLNSDVDDETPYGGFYSQEDIKEVIAYAQERFIEVIPEIDMPGHMLAALACYPELGCTGGPYEVGHKWGVCWDVLCVGNPKTVQFCKDVLDEVADLFPSKYIHIGGDETPTVRWEACEKCKSLGVKSVQGYFTQQIEAFLAQKGKKVIGWDEILEQGVAQSTTIMSWRGSAPGLKAASQGHDVIMTPTTHCYWDYCQTDDVTFEPSQVHHGLTVEKVYSLDPAPDSISVEARKHILGVQANLWTEYVKTFRHAQYQVLPRMSALAEVQWTNPEQKDFSDFKARLTNLIGIFDRKGWTYAKHIWPEMAKDRWHF